MKIGILTWLHYGNYGTALQAFALNKYLSKFNYDVFNINYYPKTPYPKTISERLLNKNEISKKIYNKILTTSETKNYFTDKEKEVFSFLKSNLKLTDACYNNTMLSKYNDYFDKFICGSDQIWNPNNFDEKYFFNFVENKSKLISYAPSFGTIEIPDILKKRYGELISRFAYLSVRENEGKKLIYDNFGYNSEVVCDPTLLLDKDDYENIINENETKILINEKYIVCYFLTYNRKYMKMIKKFAKKNKYKIVIIPTTPNDFKDQACINQVVSIPDFLNLIKNAEYVCTDSYHGMIFSRIFSKKLYAFKRFNSNSINNQNSRIFTLFELMNQEKNKIIDISNDNIENCVIDEEIKINEDFVEKSKKFLFNAIKAGNKENLNYKITTDCTGCSICTNICPKNAISINMNKNGFFEANVDQNLCIKCKKCKKVCPTVIDDSININKSKVYYYRFKDESNLLKSASGGIAYAFINYSLKNNIDVISCVYNKKKHIAEHVLTISNNGDYDINKYRKSKYLQSNGIKAFKNIANLNKGLIIALPCQIAAIDHYLKITSKRDDFILIDLICHGVPTYNLWNKYLEYLKKLNLDDSEIDFRYKKVDNNFFMYVDNKHIFSQSDDLFYKFFKLYNCYMKSCYDCNYRVSSNADIRIGDYWGEKFKDKKGTSIVLTMTDRGEYFFNEIIKDGDSEYGIGDITDYLNHQQIKNVNIPLFYYELLKKLKGNEDLKDISNQFCEPYYKFEKLKKIIRR